MIEKIIEKIDNDAAESCKKIVIEAENKADKILAQAKEDGDQVTSQIIDQAEKQGERMLVMSKSRAEQQSRQTILAAKVQAINDAVSESLNALNNQSEEDYFDSIIKLLDKHVIEGECIMMFSSRDTARIPNGFSEKAIKCAKEKGCKLSFSDKSAKIDSGFILKYGDIEINCSFDALIEERREDIKEVVNSILFK